MTATPPTLRDLVDLAKTSPASALVARFGALVLVGPAAAPDSTPSAPRQATEFTQRGPGATDPMANFFESIALGLPGSPPYPTRLLVGRAPECDVRVDDVSVSKRHAEITVDEDGVRVIRDLRSMNGTWVNDVRLDEREERLLVDGTRVRLGDRAFTTRDTASLHSMLARFAR